MLLAYSVALIFLTAQVSGFRSLEVPYRNVTQTTFPKVVVKEDYNVYVVDEAGTEVQVSTSGSEISPFEKTDIYKTHDGKYAVVWQTIGPGMNRTMNLVESSPKGQVQPVLHQIPYDKPGDKIVAFRPRLFDLVGKKKIEIVNDFIDEPYEAEDASWDFRNGAYRYMSYERGYKRVRMVELDMTGQARVLIDESSDTYVDWVNKVSWIFLKETEGILWLSERDDWHHVYMVNTTSDTDIPTVTQVTHGEFNVYDVTYVNETEQVLYLRAFGLAKEQEPYNMHIARANFDGTGFKVLTGDGDGYHRTKFLPNNSFEDRWSSTDSPIQGALRDSQGNKIGQVQIDNTLFDNFTTPEKFNAPGRDGKTLIYGIIVKPRTFDESKKYRVLEFVYAGPHTYFVPKELTPSAQDYLATALQKYADDLGVVVVQSDGMGTNWRGKTFQKVAYGNLQDGGFPDRIAWIKAAASERPWMDLSGGVGIYGSSAGGQTAMGALIWHNDFYSAAMADAGCHDNRVDKLTYGENWMGWPVDEEVYEAASNVVHAGKVEGDLLLMVGELDRNVDPASTMQVVHALNEAGRDYEMVVVPGAGHVVSRLPIVALQNKIGRFWKGWLERTGAK